MNNILLQSMAVASSIIAVMTLEDIFNNSSCFNGPAFDSNALSWNLGPNNPPCDCCCQCACTTCII